MTQIRPNTFEEIASTTAGEVTSVLDVAMAPGLTNEGRFFGLIYVESTGGATGTIQVQVRPKGTAVLISWIDALDSDIVITDTETSCVNDFVAMRGLECRAIVKRSQWWLALSM